MRQVSIFGWILVLLLAPAAVWGMTEPDHWKNIGTVDEWMEWDARFYRIYDSNPYQDVSHHEWDQERIWKDSKTYRSILAEPLTLEAFRGLPDQKREEYRKLAGKELNYISRLRNIQIQRLQRARENLPTESLDTTGWQLYLTDCLQRLRASLALDPENYYGWHLRAYFLTCAGDVDDARRSLEMALETLKAAPEGTQADMKRRIRLDLAWIERNVGQPAKATLHLDRYADLGSETDEYKLLRGLVAVQSGHSGQAMEIARELVARPTYQFPVNYQSAAMELTQVDILNWKKIPSDYLRDWLTALVALSDGDMDGARWNFPELSTMRYYPFAQHFWNDAAMIYDRTGRAKAAQVAMHISGLSRPWFYYLADRPYGLRLGTLTGNSEPAICFVGYNRFYQAGSRLAFAAQILGMLPAITDPGVKQAQAALALEQLEICQRTAHFPGQAGILKGQVYYLMGDYQSAMAELKSSRDHLRKEGDETNLAAVAKDLEIVELNMNAAGLEQFFGQSGRSQGRWGAVEDPAARKEDLRAQLEANPRDQEVRLDLARHLIRNGEVASGRELAMGLYRPNKSSGTNREAVTLILEADRSLGQTEMADVLLRQLDKGRGDDWPDAGLWSLVGAICQDHGRDEDARRALETALRMDPDNRGIQNMLRLMN